MAVIQGCQTCYVLDSWCYVFGRDATFLKKKFTQKYDFCYVFEKIFYPKKHDFAIFKQNMLRFQNFDLAALFKIDEFSAADLAASLCFFVSLCLVTSDFPDVDKSISWLQIVQRAWKSSLPRTIHLNSLVHAETNFRSAILKKRWLIKKQQKFLSWVKVYFKQNSFAQFLSQFLF